MKVSDYIVEFLERKGVRVVFGYQGSSISHVIDSISKNANVQYIQLYHEQAAAFAANGYAELGQEIGVVVACSGPGAINTLSGVANAYYDSNRCLFITGQVSTHEMKNGRKIRQSGFQETDIVSMAKGITKYAVTIDSPQFIAYELEKACAILETGRGGPVLLDIPHNIQNAEIDVENLIHYEKETVNINIAPIKMDEVIEIIKRGKRPLILLGGGAKQVRQERTILNKLLEIGIPVVSSYRGKDVYDNQSYNYFGVIGAYGNRYANYLVHFCDVMLIIGSRIDGRQTGSDLRNFASQAKIIYVDIDVEELYEKKEHFLTVQCDALTFLRKFVDGVTGYYINKNWLETAIRWKNRYADDKEYKLTGVNPNYFLGQLTSMMAGQMIMSVDVGQNQIWANLSSVISQGYFLQSGGLGAMGYALPAIIGAFFHKPKLPLLCVCGDGGFQMNIQELQTIAMYKIPVKVFVLNNESLGLIRVYQEKALNSNFIGSVHGFRAPNCEKLAEAYDMIYYKIRDNVFKEQLVQIIGQEKPCLIEVFVDKKSTCYPEPTYRSPFYNQFPEITEMEREIIEEEAYEEM